MRFPWRPLLLTAAAVVLLLAPRSVSALDPEEVLVVANKRMAGSVEVARHYIAVRGIPEDNLLELSLSLQETMPREEFDDVLKKEVAARLADPEGTRLAAVVLVYGVPLKVEAPAPTWEESDLLKGYRREQEALARAGREGDDATAASRAAELRQKIAALLRHDQRAAVDSELFLAKKSGYPLQGWLANPYFLGFQGQKGQLAKDEVVLVSRLDGPDASTARRIIDDSLAAEKEGLQGRACFDARWRRPAESKGLGGYARYDLSLHRAADAAASRLPTTLDQGEALFAAGSCPDAALYAGWYSLGRYVDAFSWSRGSIGYHIASSECDTLRNRKSSVWCLKMLEKGVAATIGPVYEPYVQGFPLPELFFGLLLEGEFTLGEAYLLSLPFISWQMVLVGDPLYRPFSPRP